MPTRAVAGSVARHAIRRRRDSAQSVGRAPRGARERAQPIDASIESDGQEAYPVSVARHLGARYGYAPGCAASARVRLQHALRALDDQLARNRGSGQPYYIGDRLSALDIYSAMATNTLAPLPEAQCAMHPIVRKAFEWTRTQLGSTLPDALIRHRDTMFERHFELPIEL